VRHGENQKSKTREPEIVALSKAIHPDYSEDVGKTHSLEINTYVGSSDFFSLMKTTVQSPPCNADVKRRRVYC